MSNHYHLYLRTLLANLPAGIHDLNACFANWLKAKYKIIGHIFQGRFGSVLVDDAAYAAFLSAYLHLNPVRAGICEAPEDYRWSSYLDTIGRRKGFIPNLDPRFVLNFFSEDQKKAVVLYEKYVRNFDRTKRIAEHITNGIALGDEEFVRKVRAEIEIKGNRREIPARFRDDQRRLSFEDITTAIRSVMGAPSGIESPGVQNDRFEIKADFVSIGNSNDTTSISNFRREEKTIDRDLTIYLVRKYCPLTLSEIGEPFALDYGTVAQIIRRVEKSIRRELFLKSILLRAEEILGVRSVNLIQI